MILSGKYSDIRSLLMKVVLSNLLVIITTVTYSQQRLSFGVHADPVISWFSTDSKKIKNDGSRAGLSFGLTFNRYFAPNYSFSSGISLTSAGGRLVSNDDITVRLSGTQSTVSAGNPVIYKIQYLVIPVGIKLQTNQIGYTTFFADLGFDPKLAVRRRADVPSLGISDENASDELRMYNLSYHIGGGFEYSLGGNTALVAGLIFDNNFIDITKNTEAAVSHKLLSFRLGINF